MSGISIVKGAGENLKQVTVAKEKGGEQVSKNEMSDEMKTQLRVWFIISTIIISVALLFLLLKSLIY